MTPVPDAHGRSFWAICFPPTTGKPTPKDGGKPEAAVVGRWLLWAGQSTQVVTMPESFALTLVVANLTLRGQHRQLDAVCRHVDGSESSSAFDRLLLIPRLVSSSPRRP